MTEHDRNRNAPTRQRANAPTDGDFRQVLYTRYVSTFKGATVNASDEWWDHKFLPLLEGVDRSAPVLEIGCGAGGLLAYLARRGFSHAEGIDISAEQVAIAQANGVRAQAGDLFDLLARRDVEFQVILAVDILEHLTRPELAMLAPLLFEALEPHGRLVAQTANGAGLFAGQVVYGDLTHMTIFTPESLAQLLRTAGFIDLTFYETGPVPIRLRGRLDVALWSAIKLVASSARRVETGKRQAIWTENFLCRAFKP